MIAPELVKKLQRLNRDEKLEVLRLLEAELADEECSEWDELAEGRGPVFRLPSVWVNFKEAGSFLDSLEEKSEAND